ncbi:MAG: DMT family transporter [Chloroflexota bacterium]
MSTTLTHEETTARGYLVALASAAILSTICRFHPLPHRNVPNSAIAARLLAQLLSRFTLLLALRLRDARLLRLPQKQLPYLLGYGLLFAVFNGLWTLSVALNGAAVATVLVYSSAAFTALLARWLLKEPLTGAKIVAIVLALAGCVLVAEALNPDAWATNLVGILTGTLAGLGYAVYSLMGRSAAQRGLNPWTTLLYVFGFATIFFLLANLVPGQRIVGTMAAPAELFWFGRAWAGWGVIILLAAGPTVAGFGLYNTSLSLLPSSVANLLLTTEPVFTAVLAYVFLGEQLSGRQIVGSGLILAGVLFLRWRNGRALSKT